MDSLRASPPDQPRPSVFLSYASEDRQAAQAIRDALPAFGLEAWYDESALDGGDAWDQKIRRQIRECDFFMPLVSAQTEARPEGYFRREWRFAVERTLDMADDHVFLLPIVIDDTVETAARVPERFLSVQWMRLPGGKSTPAFEALCARLASGQAAGLAPPLKRGRDSAAGVRGQPSAPAYPEFPSEEPGHKTRFYGRVVLWLVQCAWLAFKRWPKWVRLFIYAWLFVAVLSRGCSTDADDREPISKTDATKLKQIADSYQAGGDKADVAKLAGAIAKNFPSPAGQALAAQSPLLAIPFSAPAGDSAAQKLADSAFAQVYGRVAISHRGQVGLTKDPLPAAEIPAAVERGLAQHASYVLFGAIGPPSASQSLEVKWVAVSDSSVVWSASYPVAGADAAKIATEVDSKVPALPDEDN